MKKLASAALTLFTTASILTDHAFCQMKVKPRNGRSAPHSSGELSRTADRPDGRSQRLSLSGHTGMANYNDFYAGIYGAAIDLELNPRLVGRVGLDLIDFARTYSVTSFQLSAGGRYKLTTASAISPYLIGGLSVITHTGKHISSKTYVGVDLGAGVAFPLATTTVATAEATINKNIDYGRLDLLFGVSKRL